MRIEISYYTAEEKNHSFYKLNSTLNNTVEKENSINSNGKNIKKYFYKTTQIRHREPEKPFSQQISTETNFYNR